MTDMEDSPEPKPSMPAGPMAIEHLAKAVEANTAEVAALRDDFGRALAKLDANYSAILSALADALRRISELERAEDKRHMRELAAMRTPKARDRGTRKR